MAPTHEHVWITGASSGIGEALAYAYAARGATLLLSARRESELRRVADGCKGARRVEVLALDLADTASLPERTERALERLGHVDVMVHNGGISQRGLAHETSIDVDERIMRVNYFGAVALTKALLPSMRLRKSGRFVVVSSLVGIFGTPRRSAYAASKHALHGFFDSLRAELVGDGVGVTIVCPGFIRTEITKHALRPDGSEHGTVDPLIANGISADVCATRIVRAAERGEDEVYIAGRELVGVYVKRFAPGLFAKLVTRIQSV